MTTLAALVAATPTATRGVPAGFSYGTGEWRHVLELADPSAGSSVAWHDITAWFAGYEYTRGSDGYQGRYRASVATIDLWTDSDELAPWNPDTSGLFGVHVDLGPGLLIRSGFIRVVGGVVDAWNPRFTNKIEVWGDASYSQGKARQHRIVARDTLTSIVGVPLPATSEENWSDRMYNWLTNSAWPYGSVIYGAQFEVDTTTPILVLPDRPAASSAVNELDATLDPVGLVWYTNRLGQLVVRPTVYDTFHADAFAAGATGDQWPTDVMPVGFSWAACAGEDGSGNASYAVDHSPASPFGLDETETAVINHVVITAPSGTFDDDDPISIQRYDRHSFQASWIAENDVVAGDLLAFRANATVEARPLHTTIDLPGFHPGPAGVDYLDYITIDHRNSDDGLGAFANGYLRSYREQVTPRGCDTLWQLTLTIDVYNVEADAGLLPVEDLTLEDVTDTTAEFSWTNPAQTVTPTHTQVRLLNPASLWMTTDYPITGLEWAGLAPSTDYEFQVRLIRIDDGLITHYSPIRSLEFTTDPAVTAHVDDDSVDFPDPDPGCIIGWELQYSTTGADPWTLVDSGTVTTPPFEESYDGSTLNDDYWYRFAWREICSGVPGAWHYDNYFPGGCITVARFATAPYNDANLKAYWPQICPDRINEAVSDEPMTLGPALTATGFDAAGIPTMMSGPEGVIGYGVQPATHPTILGSTDLTIGCRARIHTAPTTQRTLFEYGGLRISIMPSGAGYKLLGHCIETGPLDTFLTGTTVLALDTVYDFALTHDVGADDLKLYINGVDEAHALGFVGARFNFGLYSIQLPAGSWITDCAVWNRVLAASELPGYVIPPPTVTINQGASQTDPTSTLPIIFDVVFSEAVTGFASADVVIGGTAGATTAAVTGSGTTYTVTVPPLLTVTINQGASQSDPATTGPIVFDVVFSEAVTGFATGDVTLSGTAGATTATVSGSGASYTVSVSGMTSSGTVIASIAAGVCTATSSGIANTASTSTDNTVTYGPPLTVTINQAAGQSDPTGSTSILFTAVFSEAVTGFATGDVTLSGTAGATTATVSGSGPTYTVTVTGMTGSGTVIASIAASVCTAVGSGNNNAASTSTDNTVTYAAAYTDAFSSSSGLWTNLSGGTLSISGGNAHAPSSGDSWSISTFDLGTGDQYFEGDIHIVSGSDAYFLMRLTSTTNYFMVGYHISAVGNVYRQIAGVFTDIGATSWTRSSDPFRMRVEIQGASGSTAVRVYEKISGSWTLKVNKTGLTSPTGTKVGMYFNNTASTIDNVTIGIL